MRSISIPSLAAASLLAACGGATYNQGDDLYHHDTAADTGNGGAADGGASDGGSADGGASDGGASDTGTPSSGCAHAWHPVHQAGWTKTFDANFNGSSGTATEQGLGPDPDGDGDVYLYRDAIDAGSNSYDVTIRVGCDTDGEGLFVLSWEGDYTYALVGIPLPGTVAATLDPYRRYLPPEYAVGSFGSWEYDYELTMVMTDAEGGTPQTTVFHNTGRYDEYGFETITLFDGTQVEAYKLVNTYSMAESSGMFSLEGVIEQWWVEGLGLVREINTNSEDGSEIIRRELTGYEGLELGE